MRYGGYKYDDDTGEFKGIPGAKKKSWTVSWSWHLPHLHMPSFHLPRFRIPTISCPRIRLPSLDWGALLSCLGGLFELFVLLLKYVAVLLVQPLYYIFYPVIKWWQVEKEAIGDGEWFMAVVWLFPGFILFGLYRVAFALLLGLAGGAMASMRIDDSLTILLVVGGLVICVVLYAKALTMARRGQLVVYRNWGDFLKSSAWIVAVPLGLEWGLDVSCDWLVRFAGWCLVLLGICCFLWMVCGAFCYNSGSRCWLALFGRFAVTFLLLFALAKLNEKFGAYKRHELGVVRGVLIPLAVFAAVFNWLIRPMIGSE